MPITDAYATPTEYLAANRTANADPNVLASHLAAVTALMVGQMGGRFFTRDASVVNRVYYPRFTGRTLEVDDIADTTGLVIKVDTDLDGIFTDETAWAANDYQLKPLNAALRPEPWAWNRIYIPTWSAQGIFSPQLPVQVTAIFGWPAVPAAIRTACIELTRILRLEGPRATGLIQGDIGAAYQTSRQAQSIIADLMAIYQEVTF